MRSIEESDLDWIADLERHSESVYSQGGEDGVLLRLFEKIGAGRLPPPAS